MNEPIRTQWQIRCAFNGFCKLALKREAMNAHRDTKQRQLREIAKFCNLSRTTVQSRRTSSMKLLKRYLEEKAYDCTD